MCAVLWSINDFVVVSGNLTSAQKRGCTNCPFCFQESILQKGPSFEEVLQLEEVEHGEIIVKFFWHPGTNNEKLFALNVGKI